MTVRPYFPAVTLALLWLASPAEAGGPTPASAEQPHRVSVERPVLGWHRAASGYAAHDYDVVNRLAYFHYKVDPQTGANQEADTWAGDPVIDEALNHGREVYLTITNFGFSANSEFLNNEAAIDALIDNVLRMLTRRGAHGACIDFEEIHQQDKDAFNRFLGKLSSALRTRDLDLLVVLPIYFPENVVDPVLLDGQVDYYVMMGYASYHLHSPHAGPLSPWQSGTRWNAYSLERNVDQYLQNAFRKDRFIVALPLYGTIWQTESLEVPGKSLKGLEQPPLSAILRRFEGQSATIESVSQSSYFAYVEKGENRQCWFESEANLVRKIDLLLAKDIAGIGFWALGYAGDAPKLWTSLGRAINPQRNPARKATRSE